MVAIENAAVFGSGPADGGRSTVALERFHVKIEGVSGTLAGPLRVARFELNHPRVHVVVNDIVIEPQLRGLMIQTLQAGSVTARESLVEGHPGRKCHTARSRRVSCRHSFASMLQCRAQ